MKKTETNNPAPDVERIIAQAYRDVAPSPGLADDLYESLDERRATTRRWNPNWVWPIAAAAALAIGFVQFRGEDEPEVAETVGMAQDGTPRERNGKPQAENVGKPNMQGGQNPAAAHPVVRVCLEQGGLLQVETDPDGWKNMSLNELGAQLRLRADTHDAEQRKQGKSGWMRHGPGMDVSVMRVLLEVHEDAPWQHTRWVMSVMAQQHFSLLSFVHDNRLVDASLPIDVGMGIQAQKRFLLQVVVFRPSTADGVFGPVEYRWTNRRTNKLEDVSRWMADAVKGAPAGMPVEGRVLASAAAPHRAVAAITSNSWAEDLSKRPRCKRRACRCRNRARAGPERVAPWADGSRPRRRLPESMTARKKRKSKRLKRPRSRTPANDPTRPGPPSLSTSPSTVPGTVLGRSKWLG